MENIADLEKLADLKEKGIITSAEFDEQKKALLQGNLKKVSVAGTPKN